MLRSALIALIACSVVSCTPFPTQPLPQTSDVGDDVQDNGNVGDVGVETDTNTDATADLAGPDSDAGCVPSCGDNTCGPDGCGQACGHCELGLACSGGACKAVPWQGLIYRAVGFADGVTGGVDGGLCAVTNLADNGAGSLRACLSRPPVWVHFNVSGRIGLETPLAIPSNTTLDGRGQQIVLAGQPLEITDADNVILHNLTLDGTTYPAHGAIVVSGDARKIWLHHLSVSRYQGAAVDVGPGATDISVGWSFFTDLGAGVVIGAGPANGPSQATVHHNVLRNVDTFIPGVRGSQVHLFNNVIEGWDAVGAACVAEGQLFSQSNSYASQSGTLAVATDLDAEGGPGYVRHVGDVASPPIELVDREPNLVFVPGDFYAYAVQIADEQLFSVVNQQAGYQQEAFPAEE